MDSLRFKYAATDGEERWILLGALESLGGNCNGHVSQLEFNDLADLLLFCALPADNLKTDLIF